MNGIHQNGKNCNFEKMYPGCLGKMANLFELNMGLQANRLLPDKQHQDGPPLSKSGSAMPRMSPSGDSIQEKAIMPYVNDGFSNRRSNGMPIKMLVAQEMSKEVNSRHDATNLVAKLMGLDSRRMQEPGTVIQRSHSRGSIRSLPNSPVSHQQQQPNGYRDPNDCQEFYEMWQQSLKSPHTGRFDETINDKKMALVRQKFIEAKRMSIDEKLRQSKQFQDALEVLSSNKDLFLKCMREPTSIFYQQAVSPPPERRRITILRPSMMVDGNNLTGAEDKDRKQMKKTDSLQVNRQMERIHPGSSAHACLKSSENSTQPTHIVVLKPSPHLKDVSPQAEVKDENKKSREVAVDSQQMCEKLGRHCRNETSNSSVFSNGYVGDQSSFTKSEIECVDDNLSDSEVRLSASRHSWDYGNGICSPSSSTFSRASSSPKLSVSREAKKRLSERWAMMASKGGCQEPKHTQKSSVTLGEMLDLSGSKKAASPSEECCSRQQPKNSNSILYSEVRQDENVDSSLRTLSRSKSVPVCSTEFGTELNMSNSVSHKRKPEAAKEVIKSSFKGKVSSLFFSRNKKPGKDKYIVCEANNEGLLFSGEICKNRTRNLGDEQSNIASRGLHEPSSQASSPSLIGNHGMTSPEIGLAVAEPIVSGNPVENQDQPSPISVLDLTFEGDGHTTNVIIQYPKPDRHGVEPPLYSMGSNLIEKSPPIGSIPRTQSWDNLCVNTASSHLGRETLPIQEIHEEEIEWLSYVKALLSAAGLDNEVEPNPLLARWHSPESPLDPSLRDKYMDIKDKETLHEAKHGQKQLTQKLVFDCLNAALVEVAGHGWGSGLMANNGIREGRSSKLLDDLWAQMTCMFSGEVRCMLDDCGDDESCLVMERVVRNEVAGNGWLDLLRMETDNLGKELEEALVAELLQEVVVELKGRA